MIVHFLQAGVQPPVLPSLQTLYPSTFGTYASPAQLSFLENLPTFESKNKMSLGIDIFVLCRFINELIIWNRFYDFVCLFKNSRLMVDRINEISF